MKRLVDTVLGLLFAQVCCELGLPHGNLKEWAASFLLKEEEELTSPADFLSSSFLGLGVYFLGFAGSL